MRVPIAATAGAAAALLAASMLGVAAAEAPSTPPVRAVSVQGVASTPIPQGASMAEAVAAYRTAMAAALADGQSKADFLAVKAGTTLGQTQGIVEGGGYINCTNGEESSYVEYTGEQPDFGSPGNSPLPGPRILAGAAPQSTGAPGRPVLRHHRRGRTPSAHRAAAVTCKLTTQVAAAYALN